MSIFYMNFISYKNIASEIYIPLNINIVNKLIRQNMSDCDPTYQEYNESFIEWLNNHRK